jgi:hypothetical protein
MLSRVRWSLLSLVLLGTPLAAQHPTAGRSDRCSPWALPARLPSAAELLDSAAAVALLQSDTSFGRGTAVLALGIDAAGRLRQLRLLDTDLPRPTAERLAAVLGSLIEPQPPGGAAWQVRLAVEVGTSQRLAVARSELCRPRPQPGGTTTAIERAETGARLVDVPAQWVVRVDAAGHVQAVKILYHTAYPDLEPAIADELYALRFLPGSLDGVPLAMTDTIPFHVSGFAR